MLILSLCWDIDQQRRRSLRKFLERIEGVLLNMLEQPSMLLSMGPTMCELGIVALLLLVPAPWWYVERFHHELAGTDEDCEPNIQISLASCLILSVANNNRELA